MVATNKFGKLGRRDDMQFVERGVFIMGSDNWYPEESPKRRVSVEGFWIDRTPVTNGQFASFVNATGYLTTAELPPDPNFYPGILPDMIRAGSLVFIQPAEPSKFDAWDQWWQFTFDANWRCPKGPGTTLEGLLDHPVVHVSWQDAAAFAKWVGKELPTEAEFEFAARGGLEDCEFAWGNELAPDGKMLANYWQGRFPDENTKLDGWEGTSPVGSFPANGLGVFDLIGNVWEWTQDWWSEPAKNIKSTVKKCCAANNPRGGTLKGSFDDAQPDIRIGRKVIKGGSHLCAENYCQLYRPAARHPEMIDTSTSHIGFRCVVRTGMF